MEGQLSFFAEERIPPTKERKRKIRKEIEPSQTYDERMKRYLHYIETKGMNEEWIETAPGELRIVIEALADYCDIVRGDIKEMDGVAKAFWGHRLERIGQIQAKLEQSIGYDRDEQIEICKKRSRKKENDVGEDALILASRKGIGGKKGDKREEESEVMSRAETVAY